METLDRLQRMSATPAPGLARASANMAMARVSAVNLGRTSMAAMPAAELETSVADIHNVADELQMAADEVAGQVCVAAGGWGWGGVWWSGAGRGGDAGVLLWWALHCCRLRVPAPADLVCCTGPASNHGFPCRPAGARGGAPAPAAGD